MTKGEEDFIEQYARTLLLQWCNQTLQHGSIVNIHDAGSYLAPPKVAEACYQHALDTGWVGKSTPAKVLGKGFSTAAAFLRR